MTAKRLLAFAAFAGLSAAALTAAPEARAETGRPFVETEYARFVGGLGFGYCEFTRTGRRVAVRARLNGLGGGAIATAWIFQDGEVVGRLDGTVASETGDAEFRGSFSAPRRAEIKIDIRDHGVSIEAIGNAPNDPAADEQLVRELTTPAPIKMGVCKTSFAR